MLVVAAGAAGALGAGAIASAQGERAPASEVAAVAEAIRGSWARYRALDHDGYVRWLAPDIVRMSDRVGAIQRGAHAVGAGLAREWSAFERPGGRIPGTWAVRRPDIWVDPAGAFATALYGV